MRFDASSQTPSYYLFTTDLLCFSTNHLLNDYQVNIATRE
jgi:hypothetical protein